MVVVAGIAIVILAVMIISSSVGPRAGSISVISSPSGASVYLDGSYRGTTPKTLKRVSTGSHTIKLLKLGYKDDTTPCPVKAGKRIKINANLIPILKPVGIRKDKKG